MMLTDYGMLLVDHIKSNKHLQLQSCEGPGQDHE